MLAPLVACASVLVTEPMALVFRHTSVTGIVRFFTVCIPKQQCHFCLCGQTCGLRRSKAFIIWLSIVHKNPMAEKYKTTKVTHFPSQRKIVPLISQLVGTLDSEEVEGPLRKKKNKRDDNDRTAISI